MSKYFVCMPLVIFFFASCSKDHPAEKPAEIVTKVLAENLSFPWEILWGPDDYIWMTERGGQISRVDPNTGSVIPVLDIPDVVNNGEGGLLGMAVHKDSAGNIYAFVSYCYTKGNQYTEKIVRYTYAGTSLVGPVVMLDDIKASDIHDGSRIVIYQNRLYISTGDASDQSLPQNSASLNGKVLRLNIDGSIPANNPIPGNPMWSKGHRNIQGMVYVGDSLFASEHGPDSDDEINVISATGNYGWPNVMGPCNTADEQIFCNANNVIQPLMSWTPTIAVCGLDYYNNDYIPQWRNSLLMCTLKGSKLLQLQLTYSGPQITGSTEFFNNAYGRLRDVCVSPQGKVYICTSNGDNDKIIEVGKE
ncbi:MAG: PQQ-dependent sugar dehydrogenase [Chitinophagaceae bacterium]|nr:PQQ-dependent sugar dehydrogenase [Chitinophagaceae bacterium]